MNPYEVRVGQVWLDMDGRPANRKLTVLKIDDTHALCAVVVNEWPRRRTRVRLDRFKPGSRGYRLAADAS